MKTSPVIVTGDNSWLCLSVLNPSSHFLNSGLLLLTSLLTCFLIFMKDTFPSDRSDIIPSRRHLEHYGLYKTLYNDDISYRWCCKRNTNLHKFWIIVSKCRKRTHNLVFTCTIISGYSVAIGFFVLPNRVISVWQKSSSSVLSLKSGWKVAKICVSLRELSMKMYTSLGP